jgi:hypothetical protein
MLRLQTTICLEGLRKTTMNLSRQPVSAVLSSAQRFLKRATLLNDSASFTLKFSATRWLPRDLAAVCIFSG